MLKALFTGKKKGYAPVIDCYKLLDEYQRGLAQDIAEYIVNGGSPQVLDSLAKLTDEQIKMAGVWRLQNYYTYNYPKKKQKEIAKATKSFASIYNSNLLIDPDVCFRWGVIRSLCVEVEDSDRHYKVAAPDWFAAIFLDIGSMGSIAKVNADGYTVDWLVQILKQNDQNDHIWFHVLLERDTWSRQLRDFLDLLIERSDFIALFQQQANLDYLENLHVSGRLTVSEKLNSYESINNVIPLVMLLVTDSSKQVRESAKLLVSKLDQTEFQNYVKNSFLNYSTIRRKELIKLIAVHGDDSAFTLLEYLSEIDKNKTVKVAIENAIANKQASMNSSNTQIILPEYELIEDDIDVPQVLNDKMDAEFCKYLEKLRQNAENEKIRNKESSYKTKWNQENYNRIKKISEKELKTGLVYLATGNGKLEARHAQVIEQIKLHQEPEFGLNYLVRLIKSGTHRRNVRLGWGVFPEWLRTHPGELTDLRQLAELQQKNGLDNRPIAEWILCIGWGDDSILPETYGAVIWPFFVEKDEYLQEAFGLRAHATESERYNQLDIMRAILVVKQFPVIPEQYLQVIYQHALSASKTLGPLARDTLTSYGLVEDRVISTLSSSKQDERIVAANWIADLNLTKAIPDLKKTLKKEKREIAKAALLSALHKLGVDIDVYLSPKVLLDEAEKGLKKAIPKNLNWFPFSSLPVLKWKSTKAVDEDILKWWIVLAVKLKQPEGNPLLNLYLEQLDETSRETFGMFILQIFISQDTACPSDDEARDFATSQQQSLYDSWQHWAKTDWGAGYKDKTLEDAYQALFRQKKSEYLGSAIGEKGMLALAFGVNAADAVQLVSRYMKDHFLRRHQIEAILAALANNNDPVVIQLLLSVARRHRTNSVQERARLLVEEIAERNGWTQDELADRTIPTAGFEANGSQLLEFGSRQLIVKLDQDLRIVLENEQGKTIKSLPAARQDDDPEQVKLAKKDFSSSKKELKQVLDSQGQRLYEAMCVERKWVYSEWKQYFLEHPVVRHLVQKLVWMIEDKNQRLWVRPTAELDLIDLEDEEHAPSNNAKISVAHISQLSADDAKLWLKHFKDEKVKPLFDQFKRPSHKITETDVKSLDYHKGWLTDAFTLRGILTKRGYQRGQAEDGGFFTHYYKDYRALDIRAIIEFSGNCVPEENCVAALYNIAFVRVKNTGWLSEDNYLLLKDIPKNLISETLLDYEAVAAKGSFEEDWEKKLPW